MVKKKVGNACRTKSQIRNSKARGSCFEYDCQESLQAIYPDIYRTSERGFQLQYDLRTDMAKIVWECKRLKGMSWNQAKKFLLKLQGKAPEGYYSYLLFKSNQQPCLVMYMTNDKKFFVTTFENEFNTPFIKHTSTRNRKKEGITDDN